MEEKDLEKDVVENDVLEDEVEENEVIENEGEENEVVETDVEHLEVIQEGAGNKVNDEVVIDEFPAIESLEKEKAVFVKVYNQSRIVSYIVVALMLVVVIVSYAWLLRIHQWAAVILMIVALVGATVFNSFHRKKITLKVRSYMDNYNRELNRFVLEKSDFQNYTYDFTGLIESEEFINAHILKDVVNTNSRNLVTYEVGAWKVRLADFVAYRPDGKKATAVFYGKFLSGSREKSVDGRLLVYLKPNPENFKDVKGPDDISDLELVEDSELYALYASNPKLAKVLNKAALAKLLEVKPGKGLADVSVSLYENKVAITLTYNDSLMVVPYKEAVPVAAIHEYSEDMTKLNAFLSLIK